MIVNVTRTHGESLLDARARGTKEVCNGGQYSAFCSTGKALLIGVDISGKGTAGRVRAALTSNGVDEAGCTGRSIVDTVQRFVNK